VFIIIIFCIFVFIIIVFRKCLGAGWRTHGFTFIVMLLYHESDRDFLIPYLATFWIVGSRAGGLKIVLLLFCVLQTTPRVPDIQIDV
jgi:hypothetical protein